MSSDTEQERNGCPKCGSPGVNIIVDGTKFGMRHHMRRDCDYAAGLLAKVKQAQHERNNAIESEAKWRERAERYEAALRTIGNAIESDADSLRRFASKALKASDE